MEGEFEVKIALGNAAMRTPGDVASALRKVARAFETTHLANWVGREEGPVMDGNGNKVGEWSITIRGGRSDG